MMEHHGTIPRVAHRHMYLWIEDQIQARDRVTKGLTTIETIDKFYEEVATANEGNKHFSMLKLRELVAKAPPYSLLYNRTLNLSTNVLKRWNRSNGMINWFLFKIGRGPPTAEEVIQVARVHLARSLIKRSDMMTLNLQPASGGPMATLGKRPHALISSDGSMIEDDDGGEMKLEMNRGPPGPPPVVVRNGDELYEWLSSRYEGRIDTRAVMEAVHGGVWQMLEENGVLTFVANTRKLEDWSEANGCWQHFSQYCQDCNVKHDPFLFDFVSDGAKRGGSQKGRPRAGRAREPRDGASKTPGNIPLDVQRALRPPIDAYGTPSPYASLRGLGGTSSFASQFGDLQADGRGFTGSNEWGRSGSSLSWEAGQDAMRGRVGVGGNGAGAFYGGSSRAPGLPLRPPPPQLTQALKDLFMKLEKWLVRTVESMSTRPVLDVRFLGSKLHAWDNRELHEWVTKTPRGPELHILFPYFMRIPDIDADRGPANVGPRSVMVGNPTAGQVQQVGVFTFEYAEDRYLSICVYLMSNDESPSEMRLFGKYMLSSKRSILSTFGSAPVTVVAAVDAAKLHKDDRTSYQLWWMQEGQMARRETFAHPHPRELRDVLIASAGAAACTSETISPPSPRERYGMGGRGIGPHGMRCVTPQYTGPDGFPLAAPSGKGPPQSSAGSALLAHFARGGNGAMGLGGSSQFQLPAFGALGVRDEGYVFGGPRSQRV